MINDYKTIYRKDYVPKKITNTARDENKSNGLKRKEYRDPINKAFQNYLCVDPCEEELAEELDSYFPKAINKYPGFKYSTNNEPINKDIIRNDQMYDGCSIYQVEYCDIAKEKAEKERRKKSAVVLPRDANVPLTSQKAGYRVPTSINASAYVPRADTKPINNLDPNHKLREVLKVTTGETEYMGIIGKLGDKIVVEQLHGYIPMG